MLPTITTTHANPVRLASVQASVPSSVVSFCNKCLMAIDAGTKAAGKNKRSGHRCSVRTAVRPAIAVPFN